VIWEKVLVRENGEYVAVPCKGLRADSSVRDMIVMGGQSSLMRAYFGIWGKYALQASRIEIIWEHP